MRPWEGCAHALARRTGAVFAYNAHELETETVGSAGLRQRLQRVIERHYIRRADVVSVVNESIAQWYREAYPGVDPVVVTNAPTGTGGVIDLRARLGIPEGELLYLHSGYLAPGRNIPLILRTGRAPCWTRSSGPQRPTRPFTACLPWSRTRCSP